MRIYLNGWASITRLAQDLITTLRSENVSATLEYLDWDAHANIQELPKADLLGPGSLALTDNHEEIAYNFVMGVATHGDTRLFRHREIIDRTLELMRPQKQIVYYNTVTAAPAGILIFTEGTSVLPMGRSENHAVQYIQAEALLIQSIA